MLGKQAKIVSPDTLRRMLDYTRQTRQPKRDAVIVLLSVKAGLRACEIAGLEWSMVMTDAGGIGDIIDIRNAIAKRGSGRRIPMHPACNGRWLNCGPREPPGPILSRRTVAGRCDPTASSTGS